MSLDYGTFLLLVSALLHSVWNLLLKKSPKKESTLLLIMFFAALFAVMVSPLAGGLKIPSLPGLGLTLVAGLFECGYFKSLNVIYSRSNLSTSYAFMRGGAMVLVGVASFIWLDEPFSILKFSLMGLLLLGLILSTYEPSKKISEIPIGWLLVASVCIGGYHLFYGFALAKSVTPSTLFVISMVTSVPYLAFSDKSKAIHQVKFLSWGQWSIGILGGVFAGSSFLFFLIGLKSNFPALALSLRNTSIVYSLIFGLIIHEKLRRTQIVGVLFVFVAAFGLSLKIA